MLPHFSAVVLILSLWLMWHSMAQPGTAFYVTMEPSVVPSVNYVYRRLRSRVLHIREMNFRTVNFRTGLWSLACLGQAGSPYIVLAGLDLCTSSHLCLQTGIIGVCYHA